METGSFDREKQEAESVGVGTGGEEEKEGVGKREAKEGEKVVGLEERWWWVWQRWRGDENRKGFGLKKRGPNMGFDDESVRRSGGLKIDDIGKRDFQSDNTSIFHSLFTQNYTWPKKLELMEE